MKKKSSKAWIVITIILSLVIIIGITGDAQRFLSEREETAKEDKGDVKSPADFFKVIYTESRNESKYEFLAQDVEAQGEVKGSGFLNIPVFTKYQDVTYKATVHYYFDLANLSEDDISVNNSSKTVTLRLPKPEYDLVLNYGEFEFSDTRNKTPFKPTALKLTLKQVQAVETDAMEKIKAAVDSDTDLARRAEDQGIESVSTLFGSLISGVDGGYELRVTY